MTNTFPINDDDFKDVGILAVEDHGPGQGWSIKRDDHWMFGVPAESPVIPAVGMVARFYGRGLGYQVRGLFLDGQRVFYRTEKEAP